MKIASTFMLGMVAFSIIGCGSRTDIDTVDVGNSTPPATTPPTIDQCPSAILASAPKAMTGNCSTRDGRTRAAAPRAPKIRWTAHVPLAGGAGNDLVLTGLVTDGSGNAFLSSAENYGNPPAFRKFDSKGNVSWVSNLAQGPNADGPGPTPFLMANGSLFLFGGPPVVVSVVEPRFGVLSPVGTLGFQHRNASDPAIGRDGSLYFVHEVGGNADLLAVSRANVDGTITWTSEGFAATEGVDVSEVALGNDDMAFIAMSSGTGYQGTTNVYAFDSASGTSLWMQTLDGALTSDIRVRPDGALVVAHSGQKATVSILAPTGKALHDVFVPGYVFQFQLLAVAADNSLLLSDGEGFATAVSDGAVRAWNMDQPIAVVAATITNDGIVIATDSTGIVAFDFSSEKMLWTVPAPNPNSCLLGVTLTSDSTVIGVQCDGTVFGASD